MTQRDECAGTAGIVLAAGGGRRLGGRPKALLPYRDGLLVERAARVLWDGGCQRVHVVLGAAAGEVRRRARLAGCVLVENAGWAEGMGGSLRAGLESLAGTSAVAAVVTLVDQPGVGAAAVRRVLAGTPAGADPRAVLAAAAYDGHRGHPVLLGAAHWPGVAAAASGDRGARAYLAARADAVTLVECGDVGSPDDIDSPADLGLLERY
ncbi:nucleotidyltransferase family protein [Streptantibioticus silvisoli]|uniref:Nucleotidyltransferase family protein n=1 Tax=Streptantibioticus silvisoli TaxID=2705255 RepID=A0ABT6W0H0_9ACTN|nr:nucleotidyltransferase family protein [Streptantibioticus silvisoli]MDI5964243.1 nucleotidyltransferase family protein [Streptantibioticus silvisoli]